MPQPHLEKIGEVNGRWKADIIESLLLSHGVQVLLVQDATTHYVYKGALDLVEILVSSEQMSLARELLMEFEEFQPETDEDAEADD